MMKGDSAVPANEGNESGHTPGPWFAETYEGGAFDIESPHGSDWGGLLVIASRAKHRGIQRMRANAYLMAAAPDLLAALKEAENALADYVTTIEKTGASLNYGHKVIKQARAAIARASIPSSKDSAK